MTVEEPSHAVQLQALPNLLIYPLWWPWDRYRRRRRTTLTRDHMASNVAHKIPENAYGDIHPDMKHRLGRMGESQSNLTQCRAGDTRLPPTEARGRGWWESPNEWSSWPWIKISKVLK